MIMKYFNQILTFILITAVIISCKKDDDPAPEQCVNELEYTVDDAKLSADIVKIDEFLLEAAISAQIDTTGLRYVIQEEGAGDTPEICGEIAIVYTGRLMSDSTIFDTVTGPVKFPLNNLITGWKIGLTKIKEGGRVQLFVPSQLAYGSTARGGIPADANLIFDIILYEVYLTE